MKPHIKLTNGRWSYYGMLGGPGSAERSRRCRAANDWCRYMNRKEGRL